MNRHGIGEVAEHGFVAKCQDCGYSSEADTLSEAERYADMHQDDHSIVARKLKLLGVAEVVCEECGDLDVVSEPGELERCVTEHQHSHPEHVVRPHITDMDVEDARERGLLDGAEVSGSEG